MQLGDGAAEGWGLARRYMSCNKPCTGQNGISQHVCCGTDAVGRIRNNRLYGSPPKFGASAGESSKRECKLCKIPSTKTATKQCSFCRAEISKAISVTALAIISVIQVA